MRVIKKIFKIIVYLVILVLIPFILEGIIHFYDVKYNSQTFTGAIKTSCKDVSEGSNILKFKEERFRSQNLSVILYCKNLTEKEATDFVNRITGVFTVRTQEEYEKGLPGKSFNFRLKEKSRNSLERINARYVDIINTNYEVEWELKPIDDEKDYHTKNNLLFREFEKGEELYLDINLNGRVPSETEFRFAYSRSPRSLLRGTFLADLEEKFFN